MGKEKKTAKIGSIVVDLMVRDLSGDKCTCQVLQEAAYNQAGSRLLLYRWFGKIRFLWLHLQPKHSEYTVYNVYVFFTSSLQ